MRPVSQLLMAAALVLLTTQAATGLHCHECSSLAEGSCGEKFTGDNSTVRQCQGSGNACLKIAGSAKFNETHIVHRQCWPVSVLGGLVCKLAASQLVPNVTTVTECRSCTTDLCNSAPGPLQAMLPVLAAVFTALTVPLIQHFY